MTMPFWKETKKNLNEEQGFTLIEALIAIAIFAVGVLGVASLQYSTVRNTTSGNVMTHAVMLAYAKMEQLKGINDVTALANETETGLDKDGNVAANGVFRRRVIISNPIGAAGGLASFTRLITVQVDYPRFGRYRTYEISTLTLGGGV